MKKILALLLVLCMMVSVFAACGGETKETEANTVAGTEGETEKQTEKETETEKQTEAATEKQTEADTEKQTEADTEKQTEADTEKQTEADTEQTVGAAEEGNMEFAAWSEDTYSPIFVTTKAMYDSLVYTEETVEKDGTTWKVVDPATLYIELEGAPGTLYNFGGQWTQFFSDTISNLGITDEGAGIGFYTTIYDVDGDGNDEYCAMFNYGALFGDTTYGGWQNWNNTITWDTADGSDCTPITFLMVVIAE